MKDEQKVAEKEQEPKTIQQSLSAAEPKDYPNHHDIRGVKKGRKQGFLDLGFEILLEDEDADIVIMGRKGKAKDEEKTVVKTHEEALQESRVKHAEAHKAEVHKRK